MKKKEAGFTIIELLVVVSFVAVFGSMAFYDFRKVDDPSKNSANELASLFREARSKAMASTQSYLVEPLSATEIKASYAKNCTATTWTTDNKLSLKLPNKTSVSTDWSICYNSRGLADSSADIHVGGNGRSEVVQIVLGGGGRVKPHEIVY